MKAIVRDGVAGWRLAELAEPGSPGPGELRVRMLMAPVNPADRLAIAGNYQPLDPVPETLGAEGVGVVEARGAGVAGVVPGDRVILLSRGNWVERRLVPAEEAIVVPASLAAEQAAMLRINPATAWRLLDRSGLQAGQWLIQNAATSSVARWVRRLAERRGVRVLDVCRARVAGLPDCLVDGAGLAEHAAAATDGAPIAGALDAVAGEATGRLAACLAPGGQLLVYGHLSGEPCAIPSQLLTTRGLCVRGFSLRPAEAGEKREATIRLYAELAELASACPGPVAAVFPIDELGPALAAAASPGRSGRLLLRLSD
jgi:NADPH:quinone reductase-like Zn-dependent oxidoreductase